MRHRLRERRAQAAPLLPTRESLPSGRAPLEFDLRLGLGQACRHLDWPALGNRARASLLALGLLAALSLLRARNRGYYVGSPRNALRAARNRHVIGLLRARYVHVIGFA